MAGMVSHWGVSGGALWLLGEFLGVGTAPALCFRAAEFLLTFFNFLVENQETRGPPWISPWLRSENDQSQTSLVGSLIFHFRSKRTWAMNMILLRPSERGQKQAGFGAQPFSNL